ncbi:outer membrane lipopolysaccharide assembly protein LptE/RlpB [Natronospira proteinivora]|uniref:LPS-assembly lipoprotein LptE n=1 Tax=Natronospira proteinivora TaxID=1807133 RepID=A0ABT1GE94_9GAMM|nr:LPS assembly lipoprotein LptE [Natronospira proteinivora]MCP1728558.1 outer membrane lipopolysaccharide assembly protein LptE/RlpB [Natronospira proteinivora]
MKKVAVNILVLTLAALVTACGWQLRGAPQLPDVMSVIYIDSRDPHGAFARELRRLLDSGDSRVTRNRNEATAIVRVIRASSSREVLSVNLAGRPEEIRVSYRVEFEVNDAEGRPVIERQRLILHRDISADPTDALGTRQEATRVGQALEEEIVQSVILRIEAMAAEYQPPPETRTYSQVIHIDSLDPDSPLAEALYRHFDRDEAIDTSREQDEASVVLRLISSDYGSEVLTRDEQGRPETLQVHHEVEFEVLDAEGEVRLAREQLELDREVLLDPTDPEDVDRQTHTTSETLRQEITETLRQRLDSLLD